MLIFQDLNCSLLHAETKHFPAIANSVIKRQNLSTNIEWFEGYNNDNDALVCRGCLAWERRRASRGSVFFLWFKSIHTLCNCCQIKSNNAIVLHI